jgi:hypothetical protein
VNFLRKQMESDSENIREWISEYTRKVTCPECNGLRLKKESLHFKIDQKNIGELSVITIDKLAAWFENLEDRMNERQNVIARELLKEIRKRIGFLLDVGLGLSEFAPLRFVPFPAAKASGSVWLRRSERSWWRALHYGRTQHRSAPARQRKTDQSPAKPA